MINITATVHNIFLISVLNGLETSTKTLFQDMVHVTIKADSNWKENLNQVRWKDIISASTINAYDPNSERVYFAKMNE